MPGCGCGSCSRPSDSAPAYTPFDGGSASEGGTPQCSDAGAPIDGGTTPCPPPPVLEIIDRKSGAVVSGTTQTVIVGKKIELMVRTRPAEAMTNIQWTVPGQRVKGYTQSTTAGTRTELNASDLQGVNLDFYWIAGGTQTVQVAATVRGSQLTAQVTHTVLTPTSVSMTSVTGSVGVGATGFPGDPPMSLYYGQSPTVGIQWTCTATAPAGGDGVIAATQLNNSNRRRTQNSGTSQANSSGGVYMLDTTVPYSAAVPVTASASATWTSNDSPSTPLTSNLQEKSVNDLFRLYFMYKPAGADSIWVTLMRLDWHWAGRTSRVGAPGSAGNVWTPPTGVSSDVNPSGVASTELPTWTDNVTNITWR